jgi:hypothetical protein
MMDNIHRGGGSSWSIRLASSRMLELDHNCNTDVNINIYFNIGTDHILIPALPSPWPSYLCSIDLFSFHPVVLTCYPPPFRPPRAYALTRLPRLRKHKGGTKEIIRTVDQGTFAVKTDRRKTGGDAGTGTGMRGETPSATLSSSSQDLVALSPMDEEREEKDERRNRGEYEDKPTLGHKDGMDMRNRKPGAWWRHRERNLNLGFGFAARRRVNP